MPESSQPANYNLEIGNLLAQRIAELVQRGEVKNLHSVVALHHGKPLVEWYGSGPDFKWGDSLGYMTFGRDTLHDVRSVTKSVVAILYGIALAQGSVPHPTEKLMPHFPQYPDLAGDPDRARLTVWHALTMTLGMRWNEDAPYDSLENSEIAMEFADDRYRYILEQPLVTEPGQTWRYSGGASALLGYLISKGTGKALPEFARESLFNPLGIDTFEWMGGNDGVASAASGLRLRPLDLARIGQLVLGRGSIAGREIVPAAWLDEALQPHVQIAPGFDYGYQWYVSSVRLDEPDSRSFNWHGGIGNGDQRLWVLPKLNLVVVITAGNYNDWTDRSMPDRILRTIVAAVAPL